MSETTNCHAVFDEALRVFMRETRKDHMIEGTLVSGSYVSGNLGH